MTSTKRTLILFAVLLAIVLFFALGKDEPAPVDPIDEILDELPQASENASGNDKIKLAFEEFKKYANGPRDIESLCKGGFISEEINRLKEISYEIVANRVINYKPLEYALNQDEAGITCLATPDQWVLFSALNGDGEEDKPYFCTDSTKRIGNFELDRDNLRCK